MAVNRTSTGNLQIFSRPFSSWVTGHRQQPLIHSLLIYRCGSFKGGSGWSPPTSAYKEGMDQWLLAVTSDPATKGSAKDLEVAGTGPVHCHFSPPPSFLTMCSFERYLSFVSPWYIDHLEVRASQLAQASERVGSPIPASQQG